MHSVILELAKISLKSGKIAANKSIYKSFIYYWKECVGWEIKRQKYVFNPMNKYYYLCNIYNVSENIRSKIILWTKLIESYQINESISTNFYQSIDRIIESIRAQIVHHSKLYLLLQGMCRIGDQKPKRSDFSKPFHYAITLSFIAIFLN